MAGNNRVALIRVVLSALLGCTVVALAVPKFAKAGANYHGTAQLSWSRTDLATNAAAVPPGGIPLYVLLTDCPDAREAAIDLEWSPADIFGPCYYIDGTKPFQSSACASVTIQSAPDVFEGDSLYWYRITPLAGQSSHCMAYTFAGDNCAGRPASICISQVRVRDSAGELDTLEVLGGATILGGNPDGPCPVQLQSVFPHEAAPGDSLVLTLYGQAFPTDNATGRPSKVRGIASEGEPLRVSLILPDGSVLPAGSELRDGSHARAIVGLPPFLEGSLDVIAATAGTADTLRRAINVRSGGNQPPLVWRSSPVSRGGLTGCEVLGNDFVNRAYGKDFPIQRLLIRYEDSTALVGIRALPATKLFTFNTRGVPGGLGGEIASQLGSRVVSDGKRDWMVIRSSASAQSTSGRLDPFATTFVAPSLRRDEGVFLSPSRAWAVLSDQLTTRVQANGQTTYLASFSWSLYEGVFNRSGDRLAGLCKNGEEYRWIVMDHTGRLLAQGAWSKSPLGSLSVDPGGQFLTFSTYDLRTNAEHVVRVDWSRADGAVDAGLPSGTRYYSADGRTVLVMTEYPASLQLFDLTLPSSPVPVTPRVDIPLRHFLTAAVSDDGSRVAVQYLPHIADGTIRLSQVSVWNRSLQESPALAQTTSYGLQFYGSFLLVGAQHHPRPAYLSAMPTEELLLYDCNVLQ